MLVIDDLILLLHEQRCQDCGAANVPVEEKTLLCLRCLRKWIKIVELRKETYPERVHYDGLEVLRSKYLGPLSDAVKAARESGLLP